MTLFCVCVWYICHFTPARCTPGHCQSNIHDREGELTFARAKSSRSARSLWEKPEREGGEGKGEERVRAGGGRVGGGGRETNGRGPGPWVRGGVVGESGMPGCRRHSLYAVCRSNFLCQHDEPWLTSCPPFSRATAQPGPATASKGRPPRRTKQRGAKLEQRRP